MTPISLQQGKSVFFDRFRKETLGDSDVLRQLPADVSLRKHSAKVSCTQPAERTLLL